MQSVKVAWKPNADRRGTPRTALEARTVLRVGGGEPFDALLVDITREGCCIETAGVVPSGAAVDIGLAHVGRTPGQIIWRNGAGLYGCAFDHLLPPGAITAIASGTNVVALAGSDNTPLPMRFKPSGAKQFAYVGLAISASWAGIAAIVALLLY